MRYEVRNALDTGTRRNFGHLTEAEQTHLQELDFRRGFAHGAQYMLNAIRDGADPDEYFELIDAWRERRSVQHGFTRIEAPPVWTPRSEGSAE